MDDIRASVRLSQAKIGNRTVRPIKWAVMDAGTGIYDDSAYHIEIEAEDSEYITVTELTTGATLRFGAEEWASIRSTVDLAAQGITQGQTDD